MAFSLNAYISFLSTAWPRAIRTLGMQRVMIDRVLATAVREFTRPPSASSIYSLMKWRGLDPQWNPMQHRYATYRHQESMFAVQRARDSSLVLDSRKMSESLLPISENYRYIVSIKGWDYNQNREDDMYFSINSNDLMSPNDVLNEFYAQNIDHFDADLISWDTMKFVGGEKRPPLVP